ncbi:hypothetical protein MRBLMI12_000477 [Microbacterium sp. LMI12-1-1.1]|uniref:hypothetical protein n=1 Tax=Microbacterium sp. LMI12-1-1.1 TaxID=3135225 RepID=UPI003448C110
MNPDDKIATLHEFDEWRQENGFASRSFESSVVAYEAHLKEEARGTIIAELRSLALAPGVDARRVNALLDQLA